MTNALCPICRQPIEKLDDSVYAVGSRERPDTPPVYLHVACVGENATEDQIMLAHALSEGMRHASLPRRLRRLKQKGRLELS